MSFNEVLGIISISCFIVAAFCIGVYYIILSLKHSFVDKSEKFCNNRVYKVSYSFAGVSNSRTFISLREAVDFVKVLESNNALVLYEISATSSIH